MGGKLARGKDHDGLTRHPAQKSGELRAGLRVARIFVPRWTVTFSVMPRSRLLSQVA